MLHVWQTKCNETKPILFHRNPNYDIDYELQNYDVNMTDKLNEVAQDIIVRYENPAPPKLPIPDPRDTHLLENQSPETQFWTHFLLGKK